MKFSIVTPTYNHLNSLKRAVGSVRGQKEAETEHIIQDGASTDGSREWLARQSDLIAYSAKDNGMYDAINQGWRRATGDILSWLNADEQYLPGTLNHVQEFFHKRNDVDVVFGNFIIVDSTGNPLAARRFGPLRPLYVKNSYLYAASCTLFFRRRLWDKGWLNFDTKYRMLDDMDLILWLMRHHVKIVYFSAYLGLFGVDGGNISTDPGAETELTHIRKKYKAMDIRLFRKGILLGWYLERALRGGFFPDNLQYAYAEDAAPHYRIVSKKMSGFVFLSDDANVFT